MVRGRSAFLPRLFLNNPYHVPNPKQYVPVLDKTPLWERPIPKYPPWKPGNPQVRIFLCQFWMKLLRPWKVTPNNKVQFEVHPQMSAADIRQYLEKIYNVSVLHVSTKLVPGDVIMTPNRSSIRHQKPDKRFAWVTLGNGETFEFPELFENTSKLNHSEKRQTRKIIEREDEIEQYKYWSRMSLPSWFRK